MADPVISQARRATQAARDSAQEAKRVTAEVSRVWKRCPNCGSPGMYIWVVKPPRCMQAEEIIECAMGPRSVRQAIPSWTRFILADIYLCRTCSCQEILRVKTPG
jgi:hypothetical protein